MNLDSLQKHPFTFGYVLFKNQSCKHIHPIAITWKGLSQQAVQFGLSSAQIHEDWIKWSVTHTLMSQHCILMFVLVSLGNHLLVFISSNSCLCDRKSVHRHPLGRVVWHLSTQSRPLKQQGVFVWICRTAHTLLQSSGGFRRSSSINRAGLWFPAQNLRSNSLPEIHNNPTWRYWSSLRNYSDLRFYIEMIFGVMLWKNINSQSHPSKPWIHQRLKSLCVWYFSECFLLSFAWHF